MKNQLLLAVAAAILICPLHAVEVTQSADQVAIANDAFKLTYDLKSGTWSATDLASDTAVIAKAAFLPGKKLTHPQVLRGGAGAQVTRLYPLLQVTREGDLVKLTLFSETTADVRWSLVWRK